MSTRKSAFTRIEVVAVVAGLFLVFVVAFPLLGASRGESKRVGCQNNLRQVLAAFHMWMDAHGEAVPWIVPMREGGTRPDSGLTSRNGAVWIEMSVLSNYAASPRILACPADPAAGPADNWGSGQGGLLNSGNRQNAVSYILGTDALLNLPRSVLTGDRDFTAHSGPGVCARGFNNVFNIFNGNPTGWTNLVHSTLGHLGMFDGSVEAVPSSRLSKAFSELGVSDDAGSMHYLRPR